MITRQAADAFLRSLPGVRVVESGNAWFYYDDPDGTVDMATTHPFATIVTTDEHDVKPVADLARRGLWRLNLGVGRERYRALFGPEPGWGEGGGPVSTGHDFAQVDVFLPHPIYAPMSWICIIAPTERSWSQAQDHARGAHAQAEHARKRHAR